MQATRVLRVAATAATRASNDFVGKSYPNLQKVWKSYTHTRNQRIRQLSPFELDVVGPLFRDIPAKLKHKVEVRAGRGGPTPPPAARCRPPPAQLAR